MPGDSHELCPTVFAPVCGTDGVTYGNACEADAAAVEIAHDGTCECAPVLCDLYCEFGSATDATGCETCACNPPPVCDEVLCDLYCEHGFAVDPTTGCETCSCSEPPTTCVSDADCGEGATCDVSACLPVGDLAVCGGECRPIEPPPAACESDLDCGADERCEAVACAAVCGVPEDGSEESCVWDCSGGICVSDSPPPAPSCESDADCDPGQGCVALAVDCACIAEPCDCPSGGTCQWLEDDARPPMGI